MRDYGKTVGVRKRENGFGECGVRNRNYNLIKQIFFIVYKLNNFIRVWKV